MQQIAVGAMHLDARRCRAARRACAAATKASRTRCSPAASSARGGASPSLCGTAEGPSGSQPPSAIGISWPPSHGVWLDALRPAWASCIATAAFECLRTEARIGFSAASVASFHRPRQPGVMRPIASTAVASMQNIAAPDSASELIWVKCQSLASPFYGRILAHRRHHDAIGKRQAAQRDRGKQGAHGGMSGWGGNEPTSLSSETRRLAQPPGYCLIPAALINSALAARSALISASISAGDIGTGSTPILLRLCLVAGSASTLLPAA